MRLIKELVWGKNNLFNGIIGLGIVCAIALGCNCSKDFGDLGKSDNSNTTVSNTSSTPEKTPETSTLSTTKRGEVPSERDMEDLVKTTLIDFNDAIQKGDFSDFHDTISTTWKKTSTPETFNQGFSEFIEKKVDISGVKDINATFDPTPTVEKKRGYKVLTAKGKYDTYPLPTRFENEYLEEGGKWKLISIRVDTRK